MYIISNFYLFLSNIINADITLFLTILNKNNINIENNIIKNNKIIIIIVNYNHFNLNQK